MKINMKRTIALILSSLMIVSVAGCKAGNSKKMGRYLEERFELPDNAQVQDMKQLTDGKLIVTGYSSEGKLTAYSSMDSGKTWGETKVEIPEIEGKEVSTGQSTILNDGKILVSYYIMEPYVEESVSGDENPSDGARDTVIDKGDYKQPEAKYMVVDDTGVGTEIVLNYTVEENTEEGYYGEPSRFKSTDSGDLLFVSSMGNEVIKLDSQTWEETGRFPATEYIENYAIVGNSIIIWEYSGIVEYDIETGEEKGNLEALEKETVKSTNTNYTQLINTISKNKLYYYSVIGLYSYDLETKESKMLIDGGLSLFGNTNGGLISFLEQENGDLLTLFNDWNTGESSMIRYYYSADTPSEPDEKVRVYSLIENDAIRQAVSAFSKANPDIYVKYEVGLNTGNGVTEADALKTLNTEIMAGNGPDILLLDNLPSESYIEKGLLEDISDIVSEYSSNGELFEGMEEAYKVDGKIYTFPTSFKIPMIIGDKESINKVTDLKSLADLVKDLGSKSDKRIFTDSFSPRGLVYSLYYLYGSDWLNDDNTINEEALTNFLTLSKDIYTVNAAKQELYWQKMQQHWSEEGTDKFPSGGITDDMEVNPDEVPDKGEEPVEDPNMNLYELSYSLIPYAYADSLLWDEEPAQLIYGGIQDSWSYGSLITVLLNKPEMDYKVLTRGDENVFAPMDTIGVNAKSKNKDIAKKFVKEILSETSQSTGWRQGMQINKAALLKTFEMSKDESLKPEFDENTKHYIMGTSGTVLPNGEEKQITQYWPNEDDVNRLVAEFDKVNVAPTINKTLLIEVAKQFEACVNNETAIEEAVKTIVDNLELYLSE